MSNEQCRPGCVVICGGLVMRHKLNCVMLANVVVLAAGAAATVAGVVCDLATSN